VKRVLSSRSGIGLRVFLAKEALEDFLNKGNKFFEAWVNDLVWTGDRVFEEEKYLEIFEYDETKADDKNNLIKRVAARFPAGTWFGVREL
jgi:hypothetical protein